MSVIKLPGTDKVTCFDINAKDLFVEMNRRMNKNQEGAMFVQNLYRLYGEFGRNPLKKSGILIEDIYELYYLCLHFPYIEGDKVKFVQDDCDEKDELSKKLEQLAKYYIYERK